MFGHAGIAGPAAIGAGAGEGDDAAFAFDDDGGKAIALFGQLRGDLCGRARLRLEGGDALGDALIVDGGDGRGIRRRRRAN